MSSLFTVQYVVVIFFKQSRAIAASFATPRQSDNVESLKNCGLVATLLALSRCRCREETISLNWRHCADEKREKTWTGYGQ